MNEQTDSLREALVEDYMAHGWGNTAAGELADIALELREKQEAQQ